jgi:cobalamin biosynthesis protein CobD/CbiB
MRVFAVILSVSGLLHPLLRRFKTLFSKSIFLGANGALTLAAVTGATQISTGGAVMYNGKKIQRSRFLGRREPNVSDIAVVKATCNRAVLVYIGFMLMLSWGLYG